MKKIVLMLFVTATATLAQGPLSPPGTPAPTMKTLDQIEARTAIPGSPAVPIAGPHFTISQPGSYYLVGNVEVASGNGINITARNVTLDLNGFALISKTVSPAAGNAINIAGNLRSIEIKNGRITGGTVRTPTGPKPWNATFEGQGWLIGINDQELSNASGVLLSHLTVEQCGSNGIDLDGQGALFHISVNNNGNFGIYAPKSNITNATATNNGSSGIVAQFGNVTNASAINNNSNGINTSNGSVTNATASSNGGSGIFAENGIVTNASAANNGDRGIAAIAGSVTNSRASGNFKSGISVGIGVAAHCVASGNSTDPATVDRQIDVSAGGQRDACVPASE